MKKNVWIGLLCLLVLNFVILAIPRYNSRVQRGKAYARENLWISDALKTKANFGKGASLRLIGDLTRSHFWTSMLPLAEAQKDAITKLNDLVSDARVRSWLADAESYEGDPAVREAEIVQSEKRRESSVDHARCLVTQGLLTEQQAAFVIQRNLTAVKWRGLYDENVQELLGMTESQKKELAQVALRSQEDYSVISAASGKAVDRQTQKEYAKSVSKLKQEHDLGVQKILTASQMKTRSELLAQRSLPADPPNLTRPSPSNAEAERTKIRQFSGVFRALTNKANALGLSAEQTKLVHDLEDVTVDGLYWIGLRGAKEVSPPDGGLQEKQTGEISHTQAQFVKHAEQVALLGILSERQAKQLQASGKSN